MENALQINNYQSERSPVSVVQRHYHSWCVWCGMYSVHCTVYTASAEQTIFPFHLQSFFPAALKSTQMCCSLRMRVRPTLPLKRSPGNDVRVSTVLCGGLKIRQRFSQIHPHNVHPNRILCTTHLPFSAFNNNVPCTSSNIHKWMRWCFVPKSQPEWIWKQGAHSAWTHTYTRIPNESGARRAKREHTHTLCSAQ